MDCKKCRKCQNTLSLSGFYVSRKGVYQPDCKECFKKRMAIRREGAREELRRKQREYVKRNKEKVTAKTKEWAIKNHDYRNEYARMYYRKNHAAQRAKKNQCLRERLEKNPLLKVRASISRRLSLALNCQGVSKHCSVMTHVGCTLEELKKWLEGKFKRGMTWKNYGKHWHVDHILPCASFDHGDPSQLAQCWHFTNLQPLKAKENLSKSNKITEPQMSLLI